MLDEKEEKRQKRNVKFSVMLMICAVIIAYEYNLHGYVLVLSFVIGLSIMWTPVVLFWIAYYVRAKRILRKNLDEAEYMIYKLMRKDPNHLSAWQQPYVSIYFHIYSISGFSAICNWKENSAKNFLGCKN